MKKTRIIALSTCVSAALLVVMAFLLCSGFRTWKLASQTDLPEEYRWIVGEWCDLSLGSKSVVITPEYICYEIEGQEADLSQKHSYTVSYSDGLTYIAVGGKALLFINKGEGTLSYAFCTTPEEAPDPVFRDHTLFKYKNILLEEAVINLKDFDWVGDFEDGVAIVCKNEQYGVINKKNQLLVPCVYDVIYSASEGLMPVVKQCEMGTQGYIDLTGELVIDIRYDDIAEYDFGPAYFSDGYAIVSQNEKWGVIDKKGETVIPCKYGEIYRTNVGLFAVVDGILLTYDSIGKIGFADVSGNEVIPCQYECWNSKYDVDKPDFFFTFADGVIGLAKNGRYGCIDTKGKVIVPFEYDYIGGFYDNQAEGYKDGQRLSFTVKNGKVEIAEAEEPEDGME